MITLASSQILLPNILKMMLTLFDPSYKIISSIIQKKKDKAWNIYLTITNCEEALKKKSLIFKKGTYKLLVVDLQFSSYFIWKIK